MTNEISDTEIKSSDSKVFLKKFFKTEDALFCIKNYGFLSNKFMKVLMADLGMPSSTH